ncbi:MAG: sigma-70 family RNA polymerase sigma factor [Bacteroidota bacterium]
MSLKDFTQLVLPYKNKLYRFALRIVGNGAEAEDVVQEVMIKMWKNREEWNQYQNVEAWCMRLTKNLSIDKLRSKHRRTDHLTEDYGFRAPTASPYRQTELNDTVARVKAMMAQLPEKQRMVMQLRDIDGMTYQEIAEHLSITLDQVKVNLFRARKKIKAQLLNREAYGL